MKKLLCLAVCALSATGLMSCKNAKFKPALDKNTECSIKVVGDYSNFEALEDEFARFNAYYPNVNLIYEKIDDYVNSLPNVLERADKPNIFFSYAAWMSGDAKYEKIVSHMENLSDPALKINLDCLREGLVNHDKDGNVVMVPIFSRTYGTLVNNNIFEKEGLKTPNTWDELLSVCDTLKEKGYVSPMMGYSKKTSNCLMYTIAYPAFVAALANDPEALAKANNLNPAAGEYMRTALEKVHALVSRGAINLTECDKIEDNYTKVILRFFEGDVPMMICGGDTVSGTKKRETESQAFKNNPFKYSYIPIPLTDKGGYFIDSPSIQFSVNKTCENLDMTNEFMRFLVRNKELNNMASLKRLVTPTKDLTFDSVFAPFAKVSKDRTFSPEALGVKDPLSVQIRNASFKVAKDQISIEDAIAGYGSL